MDETLLDYLLKLRGVGNMQPVPSHAPDPGSIGRPQPGTRPAPAGANDEFLARFKTLPQLLEHLLGDPVGGASNAMVLPGLPVAEKLGKRAPLEIERLLKMVESYADSPPGAAIGKQVIEFPDHHPLLDFLANEGGNIFREKPQLQHRLVDPREVIPTQEDILREPFEHYTRNPTERPGLPVVMDTGRWGQYVLDGHHGLAGALVRNETHPAQVISMPYISAGSDWFWQKFQNMQPLLEELLKIRSGAKR